MSTAASVQHRDGSAEPGELAEVLAADGCVVVDNLVSSEMIDQFLAEMAPFIEATPGGSDDFAGRTTKRTGALVARSATGRELVMHPLVRSVVGSVLAHSTNYQLHLTQVISIGPDSPGQPVHRDQWAYDLFSFPQGYEVQCNTMWAAADFTEANGATRVILGSNNHEDKLKYGYDDTIAAEMTKGSCLLYTGALYHGGGANQSSTTRAGINITYNVAWLRQEENQYLSVPQEIAATLDDDLLRLMGYARGSYALGYIDDVRDPISVLRPGVELSGFGPLSDAERSG